MRTPDAAGPETEPPGPIQTGSGRHGLSAQKHRFEKSSDAAESDTEPHRANTNRTDAARPLTQRHLFKNLLFSSDSPAVRYFEKTQK